MNQKIVFKFCGGCNPLYDRMRVYNIVKQQFNTEEAVSKNLEKEILIILNGCQRGCITSTAFKENFDKILNTQEYLVSSFRKESTIQIINWIEKKISVIGDGTMGAGISQVLAQNG